MSSPSHHQGLVLEGSLSVRELNALRTIAPHAVITPTYFSCNQPLHLRSDLSTFVSRYFDLLIAISRLGNHRLLQRLPMTVLDPVLLMSYCVGKSVQAHERGSYWIIDFISPQRTHDGAMPSEGWAKTLAPLRHDLLHGDWRVMYLGWLLAVQHQELDPTTQEPPVPAALGQLSKPLQDMATFLRIDSDLVAVAAQRSTATLVPTPSQLGQWIAELPITDKNQVILEWLTDHDRYLRARLLQRCQADQLRSLKRTMPARTVGELQRAAEHYRQERQRRYQEQQSRLQARHSAEQQAARDSYLNELAQQQASIWQTVDTLVSARQAKTYNIAAMLIKDLREISERHATTEQFREKLAELRQRHPKKRSFFDRLRRSGALK